MGDIMKGKGGTVSVGGKVIAEIQDWTIINEISDYPMPCDHSKPIPKPFTVTGTIEFDQETKDRLKRVHNMTTTELFGLVGAKGVGWALAVIELNRRGIHVEWNAETEMTRFSTPNSPRKTLRFWWSKIFA